LSVMSAKLRLALLICDRPIPNVIEREGDYYDIYGNYLRRSLDVYQKESGNRKDFQLDGYDVRFKDEYPNLDDYDGIVITGSSASAYERIPWIEKLVAFMSSAIKSYPHINVIAICFGHQIVARALGGECTFNGGQWEAGVYEIELNQTGKELFGANTVNIQQMHRDHVPTIPSSYNGSGIELLGSTISTPNQGFVLYRPTREESQKRSIQIFSVQGHPEFTQWIVQAIVEARGPEGSKLMSPEVALESNDRATWRNDGDTVIGKVIWDVLTAKS